MLTPPSRIAPSVLAALVSLSPVGLAACDSHVGEDYSGEPLATLQGTVTVADSAVVPADAVATVVWHVWQDGDSAVRTEPVAIEGEFPASFELAIFAPPPDVTQFDLGEEEEALAGVHIATGYVTVMPPGDVSGGMPEVLDAALGIETTHLLVWSDGEVPAGLWRFTDAIEPGYQLFRAVEDPAKTEGEACFQEWLDCHNACHAEHCPDEDTCGPGAEPCFAECPDVSLCPEWDHWVTLERVPLDTPLAIVLGSDETTPNWF